MSRFYVGQRVRIKWSRSWPELAGETGTVKGESGGKGIFGDSEWIVAPDCWGSEFSPRASSQGGVCFAPNSTQLEPATDSYDVSTWDQCAWKPEHLRVEA